jgi:glycine cleavage system aminomethyltransferase T
MPISHLKGPHAKRLLSENCTSDFTSIMPGACRHAILCSGKGNIVTDGLALCISEEEFECYSLEPYLNLIINTGRYNVEPMPTPVFSDFIYQIFGPKSLEILENAAEEDLHDIKFMRFRNVNIAGHRVRVLRMGMGGTLSYEVHGSTEFTEDVYGKIREVGEKYGLKMLWQYAYSICNHTENGFPQLNLHFLSAEAEYEDRLIAMGGKPSKDHKKQVTGSLSEDIADFYANPFEVGWGQSVNFKHEFTGKEALLKISNSDHKLITTLEWNAEDCISIYYSWFQREKPRYKMMYFPKDNNSRLINADLVQDKDGNSIGRAMGRVYTS